MSDNQTILDSLKSIFKKSDYTTLLEFPRSSFKTTISLSYLKERLELFEQQKLRQSDDLKTHGDSIASAQTAFRDIGDALQKLANEAKVSANGLSITYLYLDEIWSSKDWREKLVDPRTRNPHSCYYIPFYFPVCGSSRNKATKPVSLPTKKVERNVRPKGTHTHCKFYR